MFDRPQLGLSLAGLSRDAGAPWSAGARAAIAWAAECGYPAVQLDAAAPGVRARELDRAARRDLAAYLRRTQLVLSGLDLWIPPEHFADPARMDRAMEATLSAIELAGELAALMPGAPAPALSLSLPESLSAEARAALEARCEATGVRIADHTLHAEEAADDAGGLVGLGIDPASYLLAGRDPALAVSRAGARVATARLSDATTIGRTMPGSPGGRLDELAYVVALSTAGYTRPLVVDLRGVTDQQDAARQITARWSR